MRKGLNKNNKAEMGEREREKKDEMISKERIEIQKADAERKNTETQSKERER